MYVYIKSDSSLWTVGFYKPDGTWEAESDYSSSEEAARRVAWLNGTVAAVQEEGVYLDGLEQRELVRSKQ